MSDSLPIGSREVEVCLVVKTPEGKKGVLSEGFHS